MSAALNASTSYNVINVTCWILLKNYEHTNRYWLKLTTIQRQRDRDRERQRDTDRLSRQSSVPSAGLDSAAIACFCSSFHLSASNQVCFSTSASFNARSMCMSAISFTHIIIIIIIVVIIIHEFQHDTSLNKNCRATVCVMYIYSVVLMRET